LFESRPPRQRSQSSLESPRPIRAHERAAARDRPAAGNLDLWNGSIAASISLDEDGNAVTGFVWTGTASDGAGFPTLALGSGGAIAALGLATATSAAWTDSAGATPSALHPLYAISDVLIVPEPGTAALLTVGLVALAFGRRRSAA